MTNNGSIQYASRELFLAPAKRRFKDVFLPEARIWVKIRSLFEGEKEAYESGLVNSKGDVTRETMLNSRRRLIVYCLCDANGDPLLSEADMDKMQQLHGADMAVLQRECQVLCGFSKAEIDAIEKNSETAHAED
jgi:hypothetical protein